MKKIKNILPVFIMGLFASLTLVSCLNSSDDNQGLTDAQIENCTRIMLGNYTGKLYYFDKNIDASKNKQQIDSIEGFSVKFNLDRTIELRDFPVKLFFKQISGHDDMKAATADKTVDFKVSYMPYAFNNSLVNYYISDVKPVSVSLEYGGQAHTLKIYFLLQSIGIWKDNGVEFTVVEYGISEKEDSKGNPIWLDDETVYPNDKNAEDYNTRLNDAIFKFSSFAK